MTVNGNNALKLIKKEEKEEKEPITKDGDGGGDEVVGIASVVISPALNGWIVTSIYDNEDQIIEVFTITNEGKDGHKEAVQAILESMGIQDLVKIK